MSPENRPSYKFAATGAALRTPAFALRLSRAWLRAALATFSLSTARLPSRFNLRMASTGMTTSSAPGRPASDTATGPPAGSGVRGMYRSALSSSTFRLKPMAGSSGNPFRLTSPVIRASSSCACNWLSFSSPTPPSKRPDRANRPNACRSLTTGRGCLSCPATWRRLKGCNSNRPLKTVSLDNLRAVAAPDNASPRPFRETRLRVAASASKLSVASASMTTVAGEFGMPSPANTASMVRGLKATPVRVPAMLALNFTARRTWASSAWSKAPSNGASSAPLTFRAPLTVPWGLCMFLASNPPATTRPRACADRTGMDMVPLFRSPSNSAVASKAPGARPANFFP